jgi:hypothetical protein
VRIRSVAAAELASAGAVAERQSFLVVRGAYPGAEQVDPLRKAPVSN